MISTLSNQRGSRFNPIQFILGFLIGAILFGILGTGAEQYNGQMYFVVAGTSDARHVAKLTVDTSPKIPKVNVDFYKYDQPANGSISSLKTLAIAQVAESDTIQGMNRQKSIVVGQIVESDTSQVIISNAILIEQVTESDVSQIISPIKTLAIAQCTELDTLSSVAKIKTAAIGQVVETDLSEVVGTGPITVLIGQAYEVDEAYGIDTKGQPITKRWGGSIGLVGTGRSIGRGW